jgi:hypothetical protein
MRSKTEKRVQRCHLSIESGRAAGSNELLPEGEGSIGRGNTKRVETLLRNILISQKGLNIISVIRDRSGFLLLFLKKVAKPVQQNRDRRGAFRMNHEQILLAKFLHNAHIMYYRVLKCKCWRPRARRAVTTPGAHAANATIQFFHKEDQWEFSKLIQPH